MNYRAPHLLEIQNICGPNRSVF